MKIKLIVLFLLILSGHTFSQFDEHYVIILPQGLSQPLLNGYGSSAIFNSAANVGFLNPAALEIFNETSVGLSYQFEPEMEDSWFGFNSKRINNFFPQSAGLILPADKFRLAFSLNQLYNRSLYDQIEVTTVLLPDGTGKYYDLNYKTKIYNYSVTTSYSLTDQSSNSGLSVGLRVGLNNLRDNEKFLYFEMNESIYAYDFSLGAVYAKQTSEKKFYRIGLFYRSDLKFRTKTNYKSDRRELILDPFPGGGNDEYIEFTPYSLDLKADLPAFIRFDLDAGVSDNLRVTGSISYVLWNKSYEGFENQIEFSGSAIYNLNNYFTPSFGFIYSDRNYEEDFAEGNKNLNTYFLTAGGVLRWKNFSLHLTLADSHLLSGDWAKQTIAKIGLDITF